MTTNKSRNDNMISKSWMTDINLLRLGRILLKKIWILMLAAVLFGGIGYIYTHISFTPAYQAVVVMHVNNSTNKEGTVITQADLNASQSLVNSYIIILRTRTTLEEVLETAGKNNLSHTELSNMITAAAVNSTPFFQITVTSGNPDDAISIANAIAKVLPERISNIIENSSAKTVETAIPPASITAPNYIRNTIVGALIGFLIFAIIIVINALMDKRITSEDYLNQTFTIPVLTSIPDMNVEQKKTRKYYQ